ncbi:Pre-mRNA-splicing factor of RES complex-domain-containing protein [Microdochium trichocladiopsis]|uniref:Pre-mRNA-splicing factor of RES complex-domain-containing protein n=1 Tax=Microdochium trichocladiopsis TaxID=1682393 RepID=A0A9P8YCW1_9PEZI|nr:Pre-mRNA-splicing factor of RES complex-domain-containing protein [Microdochium trichocladiopsis]KAH7035620.1 Pre-mRNA-splicing factor of RES complex-domain-containing protein [Microdochium trichocladiopsis]
MPSDTASYLAAHYLTADPKPSKKRKRSGKNSAQQDTGLIIADDDATGWGNTGGHDDDDVDMLGGGAGATVAGTSAEFRKAKKSGWKSLGGGGGVSTTSSTTTTAAQDSTTTTNAEADAIVASAAREATSRSGNAEGGDEDDSPAVMMSDGTYAGLQSAASVSAQLEKRKAKERAEFDKLRKSHKEAETVYRDATGRRVDVEWKRAEARREAAAAKDKEAAAQQALRGEVQEEERRLRREKLDDAKLMGVARHADDEEMNRELKEKTRWGDTMAQFIEPKAAGTGPAAGGKSGGGGKRIKGRPVYQGAWAPNRYGIRPGYRWDGVDRSNGFEAERFKAINRRERNKGLEYSWQMDE